MNIGTLIEVILVGLFINLAASILYLRFQDHLERLRISDPSMLPKITGGLIICSILLVVVARSVPPLEIGMVVKKLNVPVPAFVFTPILFPVRAIPVSAALASALSVYLIALSLSSHAVWQSMRTPDRPPPSVQEVFWQTVQLFWTVGTPMYLYKILTTADISPVAIYVLATLMMVTVLLRDFSRGRPPVWISLGFGTLFLVIMALFLMM